MTYNARTLPDGRAVVLEPDGLTWASDPYPELEPARRHAAALELWAARRPTTGAPELVLGALVDDVVVWPLPQPDANGLAVDAFVRGFEAACGPDVDRLIAAIDRLFAGERLCDELERELGL